MNGITAGQRMATNVVRRAQAALPEAMQPKWLMETWSGAHGTRSLRAMPDGAQSTLHLSPASITGSGSVGGIVRGAGGEAGSFSREVTLERNGRLNVYHAFLALEESAQGSGFARSFNDRAFARYAEAGVDDVTVSAALSVGGYAWARQGFELVSTGSTPTEQALSRARSLRGLVTNAHAHGRISGAELARLRPRLLPDDDKLRPDTLSSIQELAAMPEIGRKVLLRNSWSGIREIEATRNWWSPAGSAAARDASLGPAYLRGADDVPAGVRDAAAAANSLLPRPFDTRLAVATLERQTLPHGIRLKATASTTIDQVHGSTPGITSNVRATTGGRGDPRAGAVEIRTGIDADGSTSSSLRIEAPDEPARRALKRAAHDALRELGVNRAADGGNQHVQRLNQVPA